MIEKTSEQWYNELYPNKELKILDPDGWDRTNYDYSFYEELITKKEFVYRLSSSSTKHYASKK